MSHPRDNYATMLARQVLAIDDYGRGADQVPGELGEVSVNVDLRAMVHGISRRVWMSQAQIAAQVEDKLKATLTEFNIGKIVAEAVAHEVAIMERDIERRVHDTIKHMVANAITEAVGKGPEILAKRIAEKTWDKVYPEIKRK